MKAEVVTERSIQLTMTESEAEVLWWLCHAVIAGPTSGPRRVSDKILDALEDVVDFSCPYKFRVNWEKTMRCGNLYIENADTKEV